MISLYTQQQKYNRNNIPQHLSTKYHLSNEHDRIQNYHNTMQSITQGALLNLELDFNGFEPILTIIISIVIPSFNNIVL